MLMEFFNCMVTNDMIIRWQCALLHIGKTLVYQNSFKNTCTIQHEIMVLLIMESIKCASKRECNYNEYHVQNKSDVDHTGVKMDCNPTRFPTLSFCGAHTKPHGMRGLSKYYHFRLDLKLVHQIYEIQQTTCTCVACTSILYKTIVSWCFTH